VFSWAEIDAALPDASVISRRRTARSGHSAFWHAWNLGSRGHLPRLDDDCFPLRRRHIVHRPTATTSSTRRPWASLRPRAAACAGGLPYRGQGVPRRCPRPAWGCGWARRTSMPSPPSRAWRRRSPWPMSRRGSLSSRQYFPMSGDEPGRSGARVRVPHVLRADGAPVSPYGPLRRHLGAGSSCSGIFRHLGYAITVGRPGDPPTRRALGPLRETWVKEAPGKWGPTSTSGRTIDAIELTARHPLGRDGPRSATAPRWRGRPVPRRMGALDRDLVRRCSTAWRHLAPWCSREWARERLTVTIHGRQRVRRPAGCGRGPPGHRVAHPPSTTPTRGPLVDLVRRPFRRDRSGPRNQIAAALRIRRVQKGSERALKVGAGDPRHRRRHPRRPREPSHPPVRRQATAVIHPRRHPAIPTPRAPTDARFSCVSTTTLP